MTSHSTWQYLQYTHPLSNGLHDSGAFHARRGRQRCSVIQDEEVIKKILKHLGLWQIKPRPPPKATGQTKIAEYRIDYSTSQLPASDTWLYVDLEYPEVYPP